jgi:flagellin
VDVVNLASTALSKIDRALNYVNSQRAGVGAQLNRLESAIANLRNSSENASASRSRIMDADYASETAALTRSQILQQAGTAILAQANALPQNVLSLLR